MTYRKDDLHDAINQIESTLRSHQEALPIVLKPLLGALPPSLANTAYTGAETNLTDALANCSRIRQFIIAA